LFPAQYTGDSSCQSSGSNCAYTIPYAMSDPVALNLWNLGTCSNPPCQVGATRTGAGTGDGGYTDSIYVGDMNGVLYGIKLNFDPLNSLASGNYGIYVDLWRTKPIPVNSASTGDLSSDLYRSWRQPITTQPAVSWEPNMTNVRVITGAGKYENIQANSWNETDATDVAKMSLYTLRDTINFTQPGGASWSVNANSSTFTLPVTGSVTTPPPVFGSATFVDPDLSGLKVYVRSDCEPTRTTFRCIGATDGTTPAYPGSSSNYPADTGCSYTASGSPGSGTTVAQSGCQWINASGTPDCCEATCPGTCWECIYDLQQPGERMVGKPLIAGGVVFFTTFVPSGLTTPTGTTISTSCQAGGNGYLYAFDYCCGQSGCQGWEVGYSPLTNPTSASVTFPRSGGGIYGVQVNLGTGVPSQPILNSAGNTVLIQMSTAQIQTVGVTLSQPPFQVQGWRELPPQMQLVP